MPIGEEALPSPPSPSSPHQVTPRSRLPSPSARHRHHRRQHSPPVEEAEDALASTSLEASTQQASGRRSWLRRVSHGFRNLGQRIATRVDRRGRGHERQEQDEEEADEPDSRRRSDYQRL